MTFSTDSAFEVGDTFRFETTAPTMTNDDVMKAAAKLKDISTAYEYVHVVGAAAPELWAAVSVKQAELMERYRKPVFLSSKLMKNRTARHCRSMLRSWRQTGKGSKL